MNEKYFKKYKAKLLNSSFLLKFFQKGFLCNIHSNMPR